MLTDHSILMPDEQKNNMDRSSCIVDRLAARQKNNGSRMVPHTHPYFSHWLYLINASVYLVYPEYSHLIQ
ncbi:Uncharacterised protein [Chlamydia abortus]|nr:Uncharacterised protein [Chlamydia abortus]